MVDNDGLQQEAPLRSLQIGHRFFGAVGRLEGWVGHHFPATLTITVVFVGLFFWLYRPDGREGLVIASGWLTFIVGWHLGLGLLDQARDTIERLSRRQILEGSDVTLKAWMSSSVEAWSRRAAWTTALVMLGAFAVVSTNYWLLNPIHLVLALSESVAGFFAGRILGQMVAFGRLGSMIRRGEWMLRPQPGHIDGAAGLKPVGDLYFRQAMVLAIPAVFLAVWSVLSPDLPGVGWHELYLALLVVVVVVEVSVFVVPMVSFHKIMGREKRKLLMDVDETSEKLHRLEDQLPDIVDDTHRESVADQVARLQNRYRKIEDMPTWPVNASIRRRFTIRNSLLLLPVVGNALQAVLSSMANIRGFFGT